MITHTPASSSIKVRSDVVGVALENQQDPQREITFEIQLNPAETGKQYAFLQNSHIHIDLF